MKKTSKSKSKKYPKLKKYALGLNPADPFLAPPTNTMGVKSPVPITATNNPAGNINKIDPNIQRSYPVYQKILLEGEPNTYWQGSVDSTPEKFSKLNRSGDVRSMPSVKQITENEWEKNIGTSNMMSDYQRYHKYGGVQLPKYEGGYNDPNAPVESAAITEQRLQQEQLNDQARQDKNASNAAKGAGAALGAYSAYQSGQAGQGTKAQKDAASYEGVVDSVAGAFTPWYKTAKQASEMATSAIPQETTVNKETGEVVTDYSGTSGKQAAAVFKPQHEMAIEDASAGNTGLAVAEMFMPGIGYESRSNALGMQKSINKLFGSEENDTAANLAKAEAANKAYDEQQKQAYDAQKAQQQAYMNQQIQSGINNYYSNPDQNQNKSQTFAMGGVPQMPNAEVENDEFVTSQTAPMAYEGGGFKMASNNPAPGGMPTYESVGRTHSNGGIIAKLEDGGEAAPAVINGKTKDPLFKRGLLAGKKFTDTMRNITNQERYNTKKLENGSKESKASANLMLPILARAKEDANARQKIVMDADQAIKDANNYRNEIYKNGGQLPVYDEEAVEYKDGGIHIKPENRGKFTAYKERTGKTTAEALQSPNAHVRQMANFARNAAKWKHEMGGEQGLPKYEVGITPDYTLRNQPPLSMRNQAAPLDFNNPYLNQNQFDLNPNYVDEGNNYFNPAQKQNLESFTLDKSKDQYLGNETPVMVNGKQQYVPNPNDPYEQAMAAGKEFSKPAPDPKDYSNYADYARQAAIFAGQNLGNISDLIRTKGGRKYDKESYGQMTPQMPDFTEAKRNARSEASAYRRMLPGLTGGNAGATLGMMGQMQGLSQQALAKIVEGEQQARTGVYNQFLPLNKQLQMQERADTQANKARSEDIARMATSGIAATIGGAGLDYGMSKSDQEKLDLIANAYPDYNYNKRKKAWYHKDTKEKLDPTKVQAATTTGK